MSITCGKPFEPIPNLSIATHGSDRGILKTVLVSSLMGFLYNLIDRKRMPMPNGIYMYATVQVSRLVLGTPGELKVLTTCSLLMHCFSDFLSPPWLVIPTMEILMN